jgi:hypothetical protein
MSNSRKEREDDEQEAKEEGQGLLMEPKAKPAPAQSKTPQPTDVVESMHFVIERRRDGRWRCEIVGAVDSASVPKAGFKERRLFLREFHRAYEQMKDFVFRGGVRSL